MCPGKLKCSEAAPHLETKGKVDDVRMYRPIALALMFRKILENILLSDIHGQLGDFDRARGGFRKRHPLVEDEKGGTPGRYCMAWLKRQ